VTDGAFPPVPRARDRRRSPALIRRPGPAGAPPPGQVHVQFGADAATEAAVSWAAPAAAARPRLRIGLAGEGPGLEVPAEERVYTEALTGEVVHAYHARVGQLRPGTEYSYQVLHDGAEPAPGSFRTAPDGRSGGFRFTSAGDQSIPSPAGQGRGPWSPNAGYLAPAVDRLDPLFHLMNGDLSYANISDAPVATWASYFAANSPSARRRAWMPAAGNHENEVGNGPHGHLAYQSRFELPDNGACEFRGSWYAFTAGTVRVLSLSNDDVCLQDGGFSEYRRDHLAGYRALGCDPYLRGYSQGRQRAWLAAELAAARAGPAIDWIVVCMHQPAISTAGLNGADIGVRREFLPLFDTYGVDLVVAGHEHHFERSYPVRSTLPGSDLLTPAPRGSDPAEMDTRNGTVHMVLGGGGHPVHAAAEQAAGSQAGVVIAGVGPGDPEHQRASRKAAEPAPWSAHREVATQYGFAAFDVAAAEPGGTTSITVTYYGAAAGSADYVPRDRFVMRKPAGPGPDHADRQFALSRA
jgi:hypothetical protein